MDKQLKELDEQMKEQMKWQERLEEANWDNLIWPNRHNINMSLYPLEYRKRMMRRKSRQSR
jgi:hypothetical protein